MNRDLDISNLKKDKDNIPDLKVYGDGDTFKLLCKASSDSQGFMKSTKVCNCELGCLVQVSTMQRNDDGTYAVAEALTYVPGVMIHFPNEGLDPYLESINSVKQRDRDIEIHNEYIESLSKANEDLNYYRNRALKGGEEDATDY